MINLKKTVEITGNIIPKQPSGSCSLIWRIGLLIAAIIVLIIAAIDINTELLTAQQLFREIISIFTLILYILFLLIAIGISVSSLLCKNGISEGTADIFYVLALPLIQCVVATAYEILARVLLFDTASMLQGIMMMLIVIDFIFSTLQFNYLYGTLCVIIYNVVYILIFDLAIKEEAGDDGGYEIDSGYYVWWIIFCILWHLLLTYFKNWINLKWFTSQRITYNVNELGLLNKNSMTSPNADNVELLSLSVNDTNNDGDGEYIKITMGSCVDQKRKTIPTYQALHRERPDMVLLLGDNIYADLAPPTITKLWLKCCKPERVFKDEYNVLLNHKDFRPKEYDYSKQVWLGLWDDHDYGENDAGIEYVEKEPSKEAFIEFIEEIQKTNPSQQIDQQLAAIKEDKARGVYYTYDHEQKLDSGESVKLRVIMLDSRYHRAEDESDIIGDQQWQWLEEQMNGPSDIDWYIVCNGSPVLNEGKMTSKGYKKKTVGQETRDKLFNILRANGGELLNKTILLSGDLHYSVWHSVDEQLYELTASSLTHSKPWFCCKCWFKFLNIDEYIYAKQNNGNGATNKSEPCTKNTFGLLKINKNKFNFCVKDAFGYSYLNVSHVKK